MTIWDFSKRKSIAILVSFLATFALSRLTVWLIDANIGTPVLGYNVVDQFHIHHFAYGIIILAITGFVALFIPDRRKRTLLFVAYGVGLGLIFDEFGIWLKLDPSYNQFISIIAVFVISMMLLISALIEHEYRKLRKK